MTPKIGLCILIFTSVFGGSFASKAAPLKKEKDKNIFNFADRNYNDIRIDYDKDGQTDYWEIQKDKLKIQVYFGKDETLYRFRKLINLSVQEQIYLNKKNEKRLFLVKNQVRPMNKFNLTEGCYQTTPVEKLIKDLPVSPTFEDVFDIKFKDCEDSFDDIIENFEPLYLERQAYADCIKNAPENIFKDSGNTPDLLSEKFLKYMQKFGNLNAETLFVCEGDTFNVGEFGPIKIPSNPKKFKDSKNAFFHEIIHTVDSNQSSEKLSEKLAVEISEFCKNPKEVNALAVAMVDKTTTSLTSVQSLIPLQSDAENASNQTAKESSAAIPAAAAEALISSSENTEPVSMNRIASNEGTVTTKKISESQTSGLIASANALMGPTPAYADKGSPRIVSASDSSRRSPASSGSGYESPAKNSDRKSNKESSATNKATMPKGLKTAAGLKADEFIKEEIDLTATSRKQNKRPNTSIPTTGSPVLTDPQLTPTTSTKESVFTAPSAGGQLAANPPTLNPSGGGGSIDASNPSVSTLSGRSVGVRKPASLRGTGSGPGNAVTTQIVSSFGQDYSVVKNRLRQGSFVEALRENNVTVFDLQGNKIGAERGNIIFVDKGDRFVRQK